MACDGWNSKLSIFSAFRVCRKPFIVKRWNYSNIKMCRMVNFLWRFNTGDSSICNRKKSFGKNRFLANFRLQYIETDCLSWVIKNIFRFDSRRIPDAIYLLFFYSKLSLDPQLARHDYLGPRKNFNTMFPRLNLCKSIHQLLIESNMFPLNSNPIDTTFTKKTTEWHKLQLLKKSPGFECLKELF